MSQGIGGKTECFVEMKGQVGQGNQIRNAGFKGFDGTDEETFGVANERREGKNSFNRYAVVPRTAGAYFQRRRDAVFIADIEVGQRDGWIVGGQRVDDFIAHVRPVVIVGHERLIPLRPVTQFVVAERAQLV